MEPKHIDEISKLLDSHRKPPRAQIDREGNGFPPVPLLTGDPGYVYVFKCHPGDKRACFYKIGHANNVERRIASCQVGNPFRLELQHGELVGNKTSTERYLHTCYDKYRVLGEWFSLKWRHVCHITDYLMYLAECSKLNKTPNQ